MRLDVFFTPAELAPGALAGRTAVVIDVLRASSTMVEALANGARAVVPVRSPEEATAMAQRIGRDDTLLCGERRSLRIEGFHLGNSPREFAADLVADKFLVMTTTNGTGALLAAEPADRTLVGAFLNLGAVADDLIAGAGDVALVCAGTGGVFAMEDALCAGALVGRLREGRSGWTLNDAAAAAVALARPHAAAPFGVLRSCAHGRSLAAAGLGDDVAWCARTDAHRLVPAMTDRQVTAAARAPA